MPLILVSTRSKAPHASSLFVIARFSGAAGCVLFASFVFVLNSRGLDGLRLQRRHTQAAAMSPILGRTGRHLKIKFLLLIIFLVIRKYTPPQPKDFLRQRPAVAFSSTSILDGNACFRTLASLSAFSLRAEVTKIGRFPASFFYFLDTLILCSLTTSPTAILPSFIPRTSPLFQELLSLWC